MKDLVSVIIPVYNMENSLEECLQSILAQDHEQLEVILVDDGSTDGSLEVCKALAARDSRVKWVHTENRGSGPARNTGIENSSGKYLYFPDADDYLSSDALSTMVDALARDDADLLVFGYREATREGKLLKEKKYAELVRDAESIRADYTDFFSMDRPFAIQGAPWNKCFVAAVVKEHGIEFPSLRRHQDEGFIARYMHVAKRVKFISPVLYTYYPNTVSLEWKKYPVDYYRAVMGLSQVWEGTICQWNGGKNAIHAHRAIVSLYVKAFELSYSPKMKMGFFRRCRWLSQVCRETGFHRNAVGDICGLYQKLILLSAKCRQYYLIAFLAKLGMIKRHMQQGS